jgi:hypothetical protein
MKLLKCWVRSRSNEEAPLQRRYVPLEEFELWRYMMENRHNLTIVDCKTLLWIETQVFDEKRSFYGVFPREKVIKIGILVPSPFAHTYYPAIRYYPEDEHEKNKKRFLGHMVLRYGEGVLSTLSEVEGWCLDQR